MDGGGWMVVVCASVCKPNCGFAYKNERLYWNGFHVPSHEGGCRRRTTSLSTIHLVLFRHSLCYRTITIERVNRRVVAIFLCRLRKNGNCQGRWRRLSRWLPSRPNLPFPSPVSRRRLLGCTTRDEWPNSLLRLISVLLRAVSEWVVAKPQWIKPLTGGVSTLQTFYSQCQLKHRLHV